ncbi:HNH endonuclease family protein, partial [Chloroflexota bacterium]
RTILVKQRASYNLLREFEENIYSPREFDRVTKTYSSKPALLEKGEQTFKFIEQYAREYNILFNNSNFALNNSFELDNYISLMDNGLDADYWVPPLLRYYHKFRGDRLLDFVHALDRKISSDWITGISPTTRIDNANAILKHIDNAPDANTALSSDVYKVSGVDLTRVLSGNSIYGRRYARYLLLKLDLLHHGHTTKMEMPPMISIEHILPQTPDEKSQWVKDFDEHEREVWTDRLGNLILLSRRKNSAQGNLDFLDKKAKYFRSNIELFSNSVRIFNTYSTWGLPELQTNHLHSLKKMRDSYRVNVPDEELKKAME